MRSLSVHLATFLGATAIRLNANPATSGRLQISWRHSNLEWLLQAPQSPSIPPGTCHASRTQRRRQTLPLFLEFGYHHFQSRGAQPLISPFFIYIFFLRRTPPTQSWTLSTRLLYSLCRCDAARPGARPCLDSCRHRRQQCRALSWASPLGGRGRPAFPPTRNSRLATARKALTSRMALRYQLRRLLSHSCHRRWARLGVSGSRSGHTSMRRYGQS